MREESVIVDDLDEGIEQYKREGYRLDMIKPADGPREALVSKDGDSVRLVRSSSFSWPAAAEKPTKVGTPNDWIRGRAGMEYRDLLPDRLGGRIIASHIRLTRDSEVDDYVHYHKIDFQLIYCLKGRIRVVYEDQGPPFWLEPEDCVLQPPEIRHRVLECEANSEVIEVTSPAEHETWVEHEMTLPTGEVRPFRDFGGQRFMHHRAAAALNEAGDLGVAGATGGRYSARVDRAQGKLLVKLSDGKSLAVDL